MRLEISSLSYTVLNGSMSISNLFAYCFFILCLFLWQDGAKALKQPLKFLLVSFVSFMATLQIAVLWCVFHKAGRYISKHVLSYIIECSLTTVAWLGVLYYTQIVPPQSRFTIWLKKNIKWIVYIVLTLDKLLFLIELVIRKLYHADKMNVTIGNSSMQDSLMPWYVESTVFYFFRLLYILLSSIVMTSASVATVRYLKRHMKNMESSRSPFTTTVRSQLRVTSMCTVQGVLNILFSTFFLLLHSLRTVGLGSAIVFIHYTILHVVVSLYGLGTAINFCVGQPLFRTKTVDLWLKLSKWFQLKEM